MENLKIRGELNMVLRDSSGNIKDERSYHNTITAKGKTIAAKLWGGISATAYNAMAIGIGTPSANALGSEITTNGGERKAIIPTSVKTTIDDDTVQFVGEFTFTGSFAITEEGIFNNSTSGGDMGASTSFTAVNVVSGDTWTVTHKISFA